MNTVQVCGMKTLKPTLHKKANLGLISACSVCGCAGVGSFISQPHIPQCQATIRGYWVPLTILCPGEGGLWDPSHHTGQLHRVTHLYLHYPGASLNTRGHCRTEDVISFSNIICTCTFDYMTVR